MNRIVLALGAVLIAASPLLVRAQDSGKSPAASHTNNSKTITGHVYDDKGQPVEQSMVQAKGTGRKTLTRANGSFSLEVPDTTTILMVSSVNMEYKEVNIKGKTDIDIQVKAASADLNDVIVVGYGKQKKSDVLGSVATFNPKEVTDLPMANMTTALRNVVPGVGITQSSGKPGATTTIAIRGATTFASSGTTSPLFVIDGLVPIVAASGSVDPTGKQAFDNLDPTQIETITFLKDAAATIYGARGANGVVLVTTKRGKPGKPKISYAGSYSTEDASKLPQMISGYDQAVLLNNWVQNYKPSAVVAADVYSQGELDTIKQNNYNWFKATWKPAYIQKHTLNVSGGADRFTYFAGANYYSETGNLNNVYMQRLGLRIGFNAKITNELTTDISVGIDNSTSNRPAPKGTTTTEQADQMNATVGGLMSVPGWVPMYLAGKPVYYSPLGWHPDALNNSGSYAKDRPQNVMINARLEYKVPFIKGLTASVQYGRNTNSSFSKQYYVPYNLYDFVKTGLHTNNASGTNKATGTQNAVYTSTVNAIQAIKNGNQLTEIYNNSVNWQATEGLSYGNKFGQHSLNVMLLSEQTQTKGDYLTTSMSNQVIPGYDQYFAYSGDPSNWVMSGQSSSTGRVSFMGRLSYSFKDKYLLESAFRDDASPNFPTNHQWGFFPSVSVGWKISQENFFLDNVHFLNDLKIRFNVGLTGNDATSSFSWIKRYTATGNNYGYLFGGTLVNGLQTSTVPNSEITWEKALFKDLGFDGTFGNRRFNFSVDLWQKHQYDMLETPTSSVPVTFGGSIVDVNHGKLNSWGIELNLGYDAAISRDWRVFGSVNFSASDNKVIQKYYSAGTDTGYKYPIGKRVDLGISGYKATGIVRSQAEVNSFYDKHPGWLINGDSLRVGDLNFQDLDGDGKITSNDQTQIAKRSSSLFGMGFNIGASWKGLRFSTNFALSVGGWMVWRKADIHTPTKDVTSLDMWKNSYTQANPNAALPAIYAPFATETSSFWLHRATTMYVNNMQLSYSLPAAFVAKHKIPECRFYITGSNLWNIINPTPFKDARANTATDYPILRTYTFGLNLGL